MLAQAWTTRPPWLFQMAPLFNRQKLRNMAPTLAAWGAFAGITALLFLEPTPLARTDIFSKIPVAGAYWKNKLAAAEQKD
ncbi:hypothetical protein SmJEL517_g00271 [Synchytrium microbalum]|uniref:Uncharacterized protein n=1 Tax=Synchytrium microbalum TaxID=1806994 RepID=A0A507CJM6_9FUNG|nr:uncharacterized protein SmJEL517_g00271 [Synchytrium microbalum]TPX37963.1 hypothetical protein SmJEL517_g00271 [Synchytrium microbalum]